MNDWAFPHTIEGNQGTITYQGMTLRDYFAAAVIGHLAASPLRQDLRLEQDVSYAYKIADAMLAERAK